MFAAALPSELSPQTGDMFLALSSAAQGPSPGLRLGQFDHLWTQGKLLGLGLCVLGFPRPWAPLSR